MGIWRRRCHCDSIVCLSVSTEHLFGTRFSFACRQYIKRIRLFVMDDICWYFFPRILIFMILMNLVLAIVPFFLVHTAVQISQINFYICLVFYLLIFSIFP